MELFAVPTNTDIKQPELGKVKETQRLAHTPNIFDQFKGIWSDPKALFVQLSIAPGWGMAAATMIFFGAIMTVTWSMNVDVDAFQRPILMRNPNLRPEQIDLGIAMARRFLLPVGILALLLRTYLGLISLAFLFWLVGIPTAEGPRPSYQHALCAAAVPNLIQVPYTLLITFVILTRNIGGRIPEKLAPSSLAFFVHPQNLKLYGLFSQIDVFCLAYFAMVFLAARYIMRLNHRGAWICTASTVILIVGIKVIFWI